MQTVAVQAPTARPAAAVTVARRHAVAWFVCGSLTWAGAVSLAPIALVLAVAAQRRAHRTPTSRLVRSTSAGITSLWLVTTVALIAHLETGAHHAWPVQVQWTCAALVAVVGMCALAAEVDATGPPPGVRRWAAIGAAGAIALFGTVMAGVGAMSSEAATGDAGWNGPTWLVPFVLIGALAMILGYGSAIGQLMRAAGDPLAPRQLA
jgi:hypothetical protein